MFWLSVAGAIFLAWLVLVFLFAPGILVHMKARAERNEPAFTGIEIVIAAGIVALAALAAWLLWVGAISPL